MGPSRGYWDSTTSALQPEDITSKETRVPCVYYQQKSPYEKSLETYLMILVFFNSKNAKYKQHQFFFPFSLSTRHKIILVVREKWFMIIELFTYFYFSSSV